MSFRKILQGIARYELNKKADIIGKLRNPDDAAALVFSCMDKRLHIHEFTQMDPGAFFLVQSAGNFVPHSSIFGSPATSSEPGALELACVVNGIRNVVICGHSDCKAMELLNSLKDKLNDATESPLEQYVLRNGRLSLLKYKQHQSEILLKFCLGPNENVEAIIDPEKTMSEVDVLSQVNVLQQMENVASYGFIKSLQKLNRIKLYGLWFDIATADFHLFSQKQKQFIRLDEKTTVDIANEIE